MHKYREFLMLISCHSKINITWLSGQSVIIGNYVHHELVTIFEIFLDIGATINSANLGIYRSFYMETEVDYMIFC